MLAHDDNDIDRRIVHASIASCLRDDHEYLERVADFVDRVGSSGGSQAAAPHRPGAG